MYPPFSFASRRVKRGTSHFTHITFVSFHYQLISFFSLSL
jgi:hypothetical protein